MTENTFFVNVEYANLTGESVRVKLWSPANSMLCPAAGITVEPGERT